MRDIFAAVLIGTGADFVNQREQNGHTWYVQNLCEEWSIKILLLID